MNNENPNLNQEQHQFSTEYLALPDRADLEASERIDVITDSEQETTELLSKIESANQFIESYKQTAEVKAEEIPENHEQELIIAAKNFEQNYGFDPILSDAEKAEATRIPFIESTLADLRESYAAAPERPVSVFGGSRVFGKAA